MDLRQRIQERSEVLEDDLYNEGGVEGREVSKEI
jgi:hypothetical protein